MDRTSGIELLHPQHLMVIVSFLVVYWPVCLCGKFDSVEVWTHLVHNSEWLLTVVMYVCMYVQYR